MKKLIHLFITCISLQLNSQSYYADFPPDYYEDKPPVFFKEHHVKVCKSFEYLSRDTVNLYNYDEHQFDQAGKCISSLNSFRGNTVLVKNQFNDSMLLNEFKIKTGYHLLNHIHRQFDDLRHELIFADTLWITNLFRSVYFKKHEYRGDTICSYYVKKEVGDSVYWELSYIYDVIDSTYLKIDLRMQDTMKCSMKRTISPFMCDHKDEILLMDENSFYPKHRTDSIPTGQNIFIVKEYIQKSKGSDWQLNWINYYQNDLLIRSEHLGYALFKFEYEFYDK